MGFGFDFAGGASPGRLQEKERRSPQKQGRDDPARTVAEKAVCPKLLVRFEEVPLRFSSSHELNSPFNLSTERPAADL